MQEKSFRRYIQLDPSHIAKSAGATPAAKLSAAEQTAGDEEWDAAVHVRSLLLHISDDEESWQLL